MRLKTCAAMIAAAGVVGLGSIALADPANRGKVIITEIFANPNDTGAGAGDNLEFVEIFNTTNEPIDISGWRLDDEDPTASEPFPPGTILGPRQALAVIGAQLGLRPNDPANAGQYLPTTAIWTLNSFNTCWGRVAGSPSALNVLIVPGNITIANTPTPFNEVPFIVDADGDVVDIVAYGGPGFPPVTAGQSLVLRPQFLNEVDNDRACSWILASADPARLVSFRTVFNNPTTGALIDVLADDGNQASPGIVNQVIPATSDCNNNGIDDVSETCGASATAADCNANLIPDACEPDLNGNGVPDTCDILDDRERTDRNMNNVLDFVDINLAGGTNGVGGTLDTNNNGIIDGAEDQGRVIITEILVDPFTSVTGGGFEWVEIQNISATPVDISGYRLLDLETGGDGYTLPVPAGTILQAGEIAVLAQLPATLSSAGGVNYTADEIRAIYEASWGATTPGGAPIRWIPLGRWGARATNATPAAEVLTLTRGAVINDAAVDATVGSTSGPHPTRLRPLCRADFNNDNVVSVQDIFDYLTAYFAGSPNANINGSGGVTVQDIFDYLTLYFAGCIDWVQNRGFIIDVANYSNANSNGEPLANWPGSDSHSSFYLRPGTGNFSVTGNNPGTNWALSIGGLNGARQSTVLSPLPFGFTNTGEDFGSPGFVPTTEQRPTGDVIITEIAGSTNSIYPGSNPTPPTGQTVAGGRDEFVEIFNTTAQPIDISGWYLQDEDGRTQPFPAGTILPPNTAAVIIGGDTFIPTGTNQPGLIDLTGRDFTAEFRAAWGCGYPVIVASDWYSNTGVFGLDRLADGPSFFNEVLRLVKADGIVADVANFDDDDTPSAIALPPFGWPGDAAAGVTTFWSIYTLPGSYDELSNDSGLNWAASLTGFDGGVTSVINTAVDGNNRPTGLFNRGMFGSPGFVEGRTAPVTPPGAGCP